MSFICAIHLLRWKPDHTQQKQEPKQNQHQGLVQQRGEVEWEPDDKFPFDFLGPQQRRQVKWESRMGKSNGKRQHKVEWELVNTSRFCIDPASHLLVVSLLRWHLLGRASLPHQVCAVASVVNPPD